MATYLLVNDIHLADRPPSACTDTYLADLFDLLSSVNTMAQQMNAAAVIWAGDVFHAKTPSRTSHQTVQHLISVAYACPCPVLVVPGNHDLLHDRLDSLDQTQPLGVLLASGAVTMLRGWSAVDAGVVADPVYGVPWLMRFDDGAVEDALADWRSRLQPTHPGLVVTHAPLYPPGRELQFEFYPTTQWATSMSHHGSVHYGHVHEPHGIYEVDSVMFSNPGALSRGSLHEHNLSRQVMVASWDSHTGAFTHHVVPHKPAADVFRLADVAQVSVAQARLDEFLTSVHDTRLEITSVEAVLAHVRSLHLGEEMNTLVEDLLSTATLR